MSQFGIQFHTSSKTKGSGNGKKKSKIRDRRRSDTGNYFSATKLHDTNVQKSVRRRGGSVTVVLKRAGFANVITKSGMQKTKIKAIEASKDNRNFARQNVITKGTVISTELGKAEVTNRPGRDGVVNAKLLG